MDTADSNDSKDSTMDNYSFLETFLEIPSNVQQEDPEEYFDVQPAIENNEAMFVDADAEAIIDELMNDVAQGGIFDLPPNEPIDDSEIEATQAHVEEDAKSSSVAKAIEDASDASILVNQTQTPDKVKAKAQRKVKGSTPPTRRSDRLSAQAKASRRSTPKVTINSSSSKQSI